MTPAKQLRIAIESCELPHPSYLEHLKPLRRRIEDAMEGAPSRIERVTGPSRVGKSMLINSLQRAYPESKQGGRRQVPVLVVPVPTGVSPLLLPAVVLNALGLPVPNNIQAGGLGLRLKDQLKLAGTRVVIFEEASHLVELGAKVPPRAAGDWFKVRADENNLTLFLFGVPRLERLFEHNEQLRLRSSAERRFLPYDSRVADDMQAFHACVATYANMFREAGYPLDLPAAALTYQCYLLSGGLVGVLSRFMQELASHIADEAPRVLTFTDCQTAVKGIEVAGSRQFPAFAHPELIQARVAPAALHQAFVQVMHDNDIGVPVIHELSGAVA